MRFVINQPIDTPTPEVFVDPGLLPGRYRFRLEVVDARGARSTPAFHIVTIIAVPGAPPGSGPGTVPIPDPGPVITPGPVVGPGPIFNPIPTPGPIV